MRCLECGSEAVTERPERTAQGYRRFRCRACSKQFNERSGTLLNRTQYPYDVIALVVLWRVRYKLALRDLPEMFAVRGIVFSYEAVREWEAKLTPALAEALRRRRRGKVGRSWYVDVSQGARALVLSLSRHRPEREPGGRAVQRAPRHGSRSGVLPLCQGGDRHHAGPGHDRWPRQLPPGDPHRTGPGCAAP